MSKHANSVLLHFLSVDCIISQKAYKKMNFTKILSTNTRNLRYFCTKQRPTAPSAAPAPKDPLANGKHSIFKLFHLFW